MASRLVRNGAAAARWALGCVLAALILLEAAVRMEWLRPTFVMRGFTYQVDERLLFRLRPLTQPGIGPHSERIHGRSDPAGRRRVLLLGDSFAFGVNVPTDQTIAADLAARLPGDRDVVNLGCPGYGPDQALLRLESVQESLHPDDVVLVLFPANDFEDLAKNRLFDVTGGGALVRPGRTCLDEEAPALRSLLLFDLFQPSRLEWTSRYVGLYRRLFDDGYDTDMLARPSSPGSTAKRALMRTILREFKRRLQTAGARFFVAVIPSNESFDNPAFLWQHGSPAGDRFPLEALVVAICSEEGIASVAAADVLASSQRAPRELYEARDGHLTPLGYRLVAEAIAAALEAPDTPAGR
jgi:lysophospholipase L1-like esterase